MPARRVIPCLDVKAGRVVKGVHFRGLRDMGSPVELAERYDASGADELVFLDISASEERRATQMEWVRGVASRLSIPFTVGGGVTSVEDARTLLRAGADKVAVNTAAVRRPELVQELAAVFGAQCVVAAVDVAKDEALGWRVFTSGGQTATELSAHTWLPRLVELGAGEVMLTCIDRDGTGDGFDLDLIRLASTLGVPLIASGGAGEAAHFLHALEAGADAVLAATLFHHESLLIPDLKLFLAACGQEVRPC